jgi:hypothetical protein
MFTEYEPISYVSYISPTPLLMLPARALISRPPIRVGIELGHVQIAGWLPRGTSPQRDEIG